MQETTKLKRNYEWCATGHRPEKLFPKRDKAYMYSHEAFCVLVDFAQSALDRNRVDSIIVGMALGWDLAVAQAARLSSIPFCAAIPCAGQHSRWSSVWQRRYLDILANATDHVELSPVYHGGVMHARNKWMVDHSTRVLTLWNGDETGGTAHCIDYALDRYINEDPKPTNKPIVNTWKRWAIEQGVVY